MQHSRGESVERINVVGSAGSGKSTFAKQLAQRLNANYIEMDRVFWLPNWQQPSDELFFQKLSDELAHSNWVLDGNYTRSIPIKWKNVTAVIWLDYSFTRTLFQVLKRSISRAIDKKELWPGTGNRESFVLTFLSKESIVLWMLQNYSRVRLKYLEAMQDPKYSHIKFIHLRNPQDAEDFLLRIPCGPAPRDSK